MPRALSILMVVEDPAGSEALANCLAGFEELRLIGVTGDEKTALDLLAERSPDVLLIDKELHLGDNGGISLLRAWQKSMPSAHPFILILSDEVGELVRDVASDYGADMILCKRHKGYSVPFVVDLLLVMRETIQRRTTVRSGDDPEELQQRLNTRIYAELDRVGVSAKLVGYRYLAIGIRIMVQDPERHLCDAVAAEVGRTKTSVQRAMKNAVDLTWSRGSESALSNYTAKLNPGKRAPTTNEFVRYYASKLRLEYK